MGQAQPPCTFMTPIQSQHVPNPLSIGERSNEQCHGPVGFSPIKIQTLMYCWLTAELPCSCNCQGMVNEANANATRGCQMELMALALCKQTTTKTSQWLLRKRLCLHSNACTSTQLTSAPKSDCTVAPVTCCLCEICPHPTSCSHGHHAWHTQVLPTC